MLLVSFNNIENTSSSVLLNGIDEESLLTKFLVNLLYKYEDFQMVFHVNRKTEESVNDIVQYLYKNRTLVSFVVYNYDKLQIDAEFIRPEVPNIVHLLFPKNVSYWHWLNGYNKITYNDVIVFVAENENLRSRIVEEELKIIRLAGKILLLESVENTTINLYETCFYCGNMSKKFFRLENSTTSHLLLNNFRNLNRHLLHLIFIPNFPYLHCTKSRMELWKKGDMDICLTLIGIEGHMIRLISKKMNFKFVAVMMESNTSYIEMLKYVNTRKADFAFGAITLSLDRISLIQYTKQFHSEAYTFVYVSIMSFGEIFQKFLEPFQPFTVWMLFFLCFALLATVLYVILKVERNVKLSNITLAQSFWVSNINIVVIVHVARKTY